MPLYGAHGGRHGGSSGVIQYSAYSVLQGGRYAVLCRELNFGRDEVCLKKFIEHDSKKIIISHVQKEHRSQQRDYSILSLSTEANATIEASARTATAKHITTIKKPVQRDTPKYFTNNGKARNIVDLNVPRNPFIKPMGPSGDAQDDI